MASLLLLPARAPHLVRHRLALRPGRLAVAERDDGARPPAAARLALDPLAEPEAEPRRARRLGRRLGGAAAARAGGAGGEQRARLERVVKRVVEGALVRVAHLHLGVEHDGEHLQPRGLLRIADRHAHREPVPSAAIRRAARRADLAPPLKAELAGRRPARALALRVEIDQRKRPRAADVAALAEFGGAEPATAAAAGDEELAKLAKHRRALRPISYVVASWALLSHGGRRR